MCPRERENHHLRVANVLLCPSGVWNDNQDDDFKTPNGTTLSQNSSEEMLFHYGMTCESGPQNARGRWGRGEMKEAARVVSLRPVGTRPLSFVREGWKGQEQDSGATPDLSPPVPSHLHLYLEKRTRLWMALTH